MLVSFIAWIAELFATNGLCVFIDANTEVDDSQENSSLSILRLIYVFENYMSVFFFFFLHIYVI